MHSCWWPWLHWQCRVERSLVFLEKGLNLSGHISVYKRYECITFLRFIKAIQQVKVRVSTILQSGRFCLLSRLTTHDDASKSKNFPRYWPFVRGIHRSPVNSPHKSQWRGALVFSLICVWINGWVNNGGCWFETPSHQLWRHCNANAFYVS